MQLSPASQGTGKLKKASYKGIIDQIKAHRFTYLFLLPGLVFYIIFAYVPMYGVTLAFKEFWITKGILRSPWIGFRNFELLMGDIDFWKVFLNTLRISALNIVIGFPAPIILAILFNEMAENKYRRVLQTVYTFPNFLSWVVLGGIVVNFLSSNGIVNQFLHVLGLPSYAFLADSNLIRPLLYASNIWKGAGWGSIIYLAAISSINPEIYEASIVDGVNRFQKIIHITWPGIRTTAVILLVLSVGGVMNAGFDQIFNLQNPVVYEATDIIDTYLYRITFNSTGVPDYGYSTAMGLFKAVVNLIMLFGANKAAKLLGEGGVF